MWEQVMSKFHTTYTSSLGSENFLYLNTSWPYFLGLTVHMLWPLIFFGPWWRKDTIITLIFKVPYEMNSLVFVQTYLPSKFIVIHSRIVDQTCSCNLITCSQMKGFSTNNRHWYLCIGSDHRGKGWSQDSLFICQVNVCYSVKSMKVSF